MSRISIETGQAADSSWTASPECLETDFRSNENSNQSLTGPKLGFTGLRCLSKVSAKCIANQLARPSNAVQCKYWTHLRKERLIDPQEALLGQLAGRAVFLKTCGFELEHVSYLSVNGDFVEDAFTFIPARKKERMRLIDQTRLFQRVAV